MNREDVDRGAVTATETLIVDELRRRPSGMTLYELAWAFGYGPLRGAFLHWPLSRLERRGVITSRYRMGYDGAQERVYSICEKKGTDMGMPEKVTGVDLSDEEQLADVQPMALGDTAEELLEDEDAREEEDEDEEDEGRTPDST